MRPPYTADRAYRFSLLPLGLLLAVGGVIIAVGSTVLPITWVPFVQHEGTKRLVIAVIGLLNFLIGVGLCLKSTIAWFGLFVYLLLGTAWGVIGNLFDPPYMEGPQYASAVIVLVFSGVLSIGIYAATKPVFRTPRHD